MSDNKKIPNSPNSEASPRHGPYTRPVTRGSDQYRDKRAYTDSREGRYGDRGHFEGDRDVRGDYTNTSYDGGGLYHNNNNHNNNTRTRDSGYDNTSGHWESNNSRRPYNDNIGGGNGGYYQSRGGGNDGRYTQHSNQARSGHHESRAPGPGHRSSTPDQSSTFRPVINSEMSDKEAKIDTRGDYGNRPPTQPRGYTDKNDETIRLPTGPRLHYSNRDGHGHDKDRLYAPHGIGSGSGAGAVGAASNAHSSSNSSGISPVDDRKSHYQDINKTVPTGPRMDNRSTRSNVNHGNRGGYRGNYGPSSGSYDSFSSRSQAQYSHNDDYRTSTQRDNKSSGGYRNATEYSGSKPPPSGSTITTSAKTIHGHNIHNQNILGMVSDVRRRSDTSYVEAEERKIQPLEVTHVRSNKPLSVTQSSEFREVKKLTSELAGIESRLDVAANKYNTTLQSARELERELQRDRLRVELAEQALDKFRG